MGHKFTKSIKQWLKTPEAVKLHSQEMMLAQAGSPLAIENAHRNLLDMEDDE